MNPKFEHLDESIFRWPVVHILKHRSSILRNSKKAFHSLMDDLKLASIANFLDQIRYQTGLEVFRLCYSSISPQSFRVVRYLWLLLSKLKSEMSLRREESGT